MNKMTISKLAINSGIGVEAIRFYQRKGLLREPSSAGGIRYYNEDDVARIVFIKKIQELGFSLGEIKELLELNTKPRQTCSTVKKKTLVKLDEINRKIDSLLRIKKMLEKISCDCDSSKDQIRDYKVQDCFNFEFGCSQKDM